MSLFNQPHARSGPLADRLRPTGFPDYVGQEAVVGPQSALRGALREGKLPSMIFWGPPGCGKTTLARILAAEAGLDYVQFSAVTSGVKEIREFIDRARATRDMSGRGTILFVDEIHRFNKSQQDAFLPHVEAGTITLIGATTENPSFSVNAAVLSRCKVLRLHALDEDDLAGLLARALSDGERGLGARLVTAAPEALRLIAQSASGDARRALGLLETAVTLLPEGQATLEPDDVKRGAEERTLLYDKSGEEHYNVSSALIKAMRGNDPDAAIYWLLRMLDAGDDPLFLSRRLIIFASEDVGNADPRALQVAVAADDAFRRVGLPEGVYPLAHACLYLASCPKSNAVKRAIEATRASLAERGALPVPMKLRNAVTPLMRDEGYGQGYQYAHDFPGSHVAGESYLPDELVGRRLYQPSNEGLEKQIRERLERINRRPEK